MRKCVSVQVCLCTSEMKVTLQLCVFMLLVHASLAVWQSKTVLKGRTLELHCPIKPQFQSHPMEWKNPDGNIMFFDTYEGVKDKRYSLVRRSESESIIRISDVTFSDGGIYTCTHYLQRAEDKTVQVTVLARPKVELITDQGKAVIKCTAEGNYPPPAISWQFKKGPEFHTHAQITKEDKKFVAIETLTILIEKATHVKCIVRHPALHSKPLMDFVIITPNGKTKRPRTTTSSPETTPALKTPSEITTDRFSTAEKEGSEFSSTADFSTRGKTRTTTETTREVTTDRFSTTEKEDSEFSTTANFSTRDAKYSTTSLPLNTSQSNSSDGSTVALPDSTTQNQTSRSWNTTDLTTAQTDIPFNETKRNSTDNGHDVGMQTVNEGSASALIFLVTCLIVGLVVVLIFIFIKLRRAHIAWKRENDDSNQTSETSGKSKSSQEDKNGQKRRGFFNTGITHYVVQEPAVITSVTNPHAMTTPEDTAKTEEIAPVPPPPQTTAKSKIKETEL